MRSPQVSKQNMIITSCYRSPRAVFRSGAAAVEGTWPYAFCSGDRCWWLPSEVPQLPSPGLRATTLLLSPITSPNSPRKAKAHPKGRSTTPIQPSSSLLKRHALHGLLDVHDEGGQGGKEKNRLLALTEGTPRAPRIFYSS